MGQNVVGLQIARIAPQLSLVHQAGSPNARFGLERAMQILTGPLVSRHLEIAAGTTSAAQQLIARSEDDLAQLFNTLLPEQMMQLGLALHAIMTAYEHHQESLTTLERALWNSLRESSLLDLATPIAPRELTETVSWAERNADLYTQRGRLKRLPPKKAFALSSRAIQAFKVLAQENPERCLEIVRELLLGKRALCVIEKKRGTEIFCFGTTHREHAYTWYLAGEVLQMISDAEIINQFTREFLAPRKKSLPSGIIYIEDEFSFETGIQPRNGQPRALYAVGTKNWYDAAQTHAAVEALFWLFQYEQSYYAGGEIDYYFMNTGKAGQNATPVFSEDFYQRAIKRCALLDDQPGVAERAWSFLFHYVVDLAPIDAGYLGKVLEVGLHSSFRLPYPSVAAALRKHASKRVQFNEMWKTLDAAQKETFCQIYQQAAEQPRAPHREFAQLAFMAPTGDWAFHSSFRDAYLNIIQENPLNKDLHQRYEDIFGEKTLVIKKLEAILLLALHAFNETRLYELPKWFGMDVSEKNIIKLISLLLDYYGENAKEALQRLDALLANVTLPKSVQRHLLKKRLFSLLPFS